MIDILVQIHDFFYGINERNHYKRTNIVMCIICNGIYRSAIYILSAYLRLKSYVAYSNNHLNSDEKQILVSLTTFPARLGNVWMTIESLLRQTVLPDKILINLAEEEFTDKIGLLPSSLKRYLNQGIEIVFHKDNLKPHNKYYYAICDYDYKYVITVDDDLYYNKHTIERLLDLQEKYPNMVCTNRARIMQIENHTFAPYCQWRQKLDDDGACSHKIVALGYGGVLYPTHIIKRFNMLFNKSEIKEYSPKADDLWLKANEIIENVKVCAGSYMASPVEISGSQTISLKSSNNSSIQSGNDIQWKSLSEHFNLQFYFENLLD